jgi:hypothetical protein
MNVYFGFEVGKRVTSGGSSSGTVTEPKHKPSEEMFEKRCVPVVWDEDKTTNTISWTKSDNLQKI